MKRNEAYRARISAGIMGAVLTLSAVEHTQAVETLAVRQSTEFNLQINGDVAPSAVFGNSTWTSDGDLITINNTAQPVPGTMGWDNELNPGAGYTVETRFRITTPEQGGIGVLGVIVGDGSGGADYHALVIKATGIAMNNVAIVSDVDFTDGFHVLRIVDKPNVQGLSIWLNGDLLVEDQVNPVPFFNLNRAYLGKTGGQLSSGAVEIDYFRVDTSGAYRPVPEPASIAVLSLGAMMLMRRRRRR